MRNRVASLGAKLATVHAGLLGTAREGTDAGAAPAVPLEARRFGLLVIVAGALVVGYYYGRLVYFRDKLAPRLIAQGDLQAPQSPAELETWAVLWQAGAQLVIYAIVPLLLARVVLRVPLGELGLWPRRESLRAGGFAAGALLAAVPLLIVASDWPEVRWGWPQLGAGFGVLVAHVVAHEVLLRGLVVHGLHPVVGRSSVLIAAVPFALLGFGSMATSLAALAGALVLGWLALAGRSIYPAIALHLGALLVLSRLLG